MASDWPDDDLLHHAIPGLRTTMAPWDPYTRIYGADHVDEPTWGYKANLVYNAKTVLLKLGYGGPLTLYWYGDQPFPAYLHPHRAMVCAVIAPTLDSMDHHDLAPSVGRSSIVIEENPSKSPSAPRWGLSPWPPTFRRVQKGGADEDG